MNKKPFTVSESDFAAWLVCHLRYLFRSIGTKKSQPSLQKVVGDGTHEAVAVEDATERAAIVEKHVERLPEEQRAEAKKMMESQIKVADQQDEDEEPVIGEEKEKLERWRVPGTDREFVMKSDKIGWGTDDLGRQHLRITDRKSGLNPDWVVWKTKMELSFARLELARLEKNRDAVATRVSKLEAEVATLEGGARAAAEKKLPYQREVLAREKAKADEALIVVKKLAGKLKRQIRKYERVRTQLFFFAMVAEQTRDFHQASQLCAQFLGEVSTEERAHVEKLKEDYRKYERVRTQLFFFAMVAEQTRDFHQASQLCAQFLGEVSTEERAHVEKLKEDYRKHFGQPDREPDPNGFGFWYKPEMGAEALERYLEQIPEMEEARAARDADATTGGHCFDCDYRDSCPAFKAWQEARNGSNLIPLRVSVPAKGGEEKTA